MPSNPETPRTGNRQILLVRNPVENCPDYEEREMHGCRIRVIPWLEPHDRTDPARLLKANDALIAHLQDDVEQFLQLACRQHNSLGDLTTRIVVFTGYDPETARRRLGLDDYGIEIVRQPLNRAELWSLNWEYAIREWGHGQRFPWEHLLRRMYPNMQALAVLAQAWLLLNEGGVPASELAKKWQGWIGVFDRDLVTAEIAGMRTREPDLASELAGFESAWTSDPAELYRLCSRICSRF